MKRNIIALLGALLLLSGTAFADAPASGTVGGNEIHVSAEGLNPGYYLGAVWDGDKLLTFFDTPVGSDGKLDLSVNIGEALEQGDRLTVGISGANTGSAPISSDVVLETPDTPAPPPAPIYPVGPIRPIYRPGSTGKPSTPDKPDTSEPSGEPAEPSPPSAEEPALPFTDVAADSWYYEAVRYVYEKGMMSGTLPDIFAPHAAASRGMLVTILHRLEGAPAAKEAHFTDVASHQWYAGAVAWAASNGITGGYSDGRFGPDDAITREQLAAILYRYAAYKGYDVSRQASLSGYQDAGQISTYALEAMGWANAAGLVKGTGASQLSPKSGAVRAEVAAVLMRLCEHIAP